MSGFYCIWPKLSQTLKPLQVGSAEFVEKGLYLRERGVFYDAIAQGYPYVVDGVNADDLQDYRPGIQAAQERGAQSPLAEVGMSKMEVRELSKFLDLPWWDKPAQPCLSSRFPYGEAITVEKLQRVGRAEVYLRRSGWQNIRVRSQGDTARIEVLPEEVRKFVLESDLPTLIATFKTHGFLYVTLDLEGYRSGKLNDVLGLHNSGQIG